MNHKEYNSRLGDLQIQLLKKCEAQRIAQETGDHAEDIRLQAEISPIKVQAEELKEGARRAGLPV
jgi:hypothetical protein